MARNNKAFSMSDLLNKLIKRLIRDGFTIAKMGFDRSSGMPKIEIQNCKHCRTLRGAIYRTESNGQGKTYTWQTMISNCRVEWKTTGECK